MSLAERRLNRRGFIQAFVVAAGVTAIAAIGGCAPAATPTATPAPAKPAAEAPKPTEAPKPAAESKPTEAPKPTAAPKPTEAPATKPAPAAATPRIVRILSDSWALNEVPIDRQAALFNEKYRGKVEVRVEAKGEGWDTKLMSQIKAGTLEWSGEMVTPMPSRTALIILSGRNQPMDTFVKSSQEDGASQVMQDMISTVLQSASHEKRLYSIPYSFENNSYIWRVDHYEAQGITEAPATFDELFDASMRVKRDPKMKGITPFAFIEDMDASIVPIITGSTDKPYTEDGIFDLNSPVAIEGLLFMRKLVENDLVPPHTWDNWWPLYQKGKLSAVFAQSSRGVWGEKIFGRASIRTSPTPLKTKGGPNAGSYFWINGTTILNKAPYPQEATDFLVFAFGPQNKPMQEAIIQSGKTPVYESAYKDYIEGNPDYEGYKWMVGMRKSVESNVVIPPTLLWRLQVQTFLKHAVKFLEKGSNMKPQELADVVMKETREAGKKLEADLRASQ